MALARLILHFCGNFDTKKVEAILERLSDGGGESEAISFFFTADNFVGGVIGVESGGEVGEISDEIIGSVINSDALDDLREAIKEFFYRTNHGGRPSVNRFIAGLF